MLDVLTDEALPVRLPKGFVVGSYVVDRWFRDGGMASIYRAYHAGESRCVALKLQLPSIVHDPTMCERFEREAALMRRAAGSQRVAGVLESGALDDRRRFIVMEWVEGENLEELLDAVRNEDRRLSIVRACQICRDVALGLADLHAQGVVHLDVKPANIMVRRGADGSDEIKLVDFGIAADLREGEARTEAPSSVGSAVLGTSAYVAPERARGGAADPSSDVFALGVVLFESISGSSLPPHGWTPELLPRLETLRRDVPLELSELVRSCMAVDRGQRPASAQQVASALAEVIGTLEQSGERRATSSAEETPVRSGVTEIAPRPTLTSAAAEHADPPVQSGATEVSLTHEDVRLCVGETIGRADEARPMGPEHGALASGIDELEEPSREASNASSVERTVARACVEAEASTVGPMRRPRLRWAVLGAIASILAVGAWLEWRENVGSQRLASTSPVRDEASDATASATAMLSSEVPSVRAGRASILAPDRAENPSDLRPVRSADPTPHHAGASSDACRRKRAEASHAKDERRWREVLRLTAPTSCWTGARQRLQRKRLRVEAHAELHEYARCADEGAGSRDDEIQKRARYCRTKLGQG